MFVGFLINAAIIITFGYWYKTEKDITIESAGDEFDDNFFNGAKIIFAAGVLAAS